jgi:hypothetical protein
MELLNKFSVCCVCLPVAVLDFPLVRCRRDLTRDEVTTGANFESVDDSSGLVACPWQILPGTCEEVTSALAATGDDVPKGTTVTSAG